jgi:hypothetical protein
MLERRKTVIAGLSLLLVALATFTFGSSAQTNRQRGKNAPAPLPPTVTLSADQSLITVCQRDSSAANSRVQLRADARSPEGQTLNYNWQTSGGRLEGTGAETTWDLSGAAPGRYTASVEVTTPDPGCAAFTSTMVHVVECAPVPEVCPAISVSCPATVAPGSPVTFTAELTGGTPGRTPAFNWTVTNGEISGGQGSPSITVNTAGARDAEMRATVRVAGFGPECSASCVTLSPAPPPPPRRPERFDEFGDIARNDEKARLDSFAVRLQEDQTAQGYIIVYGARKGRAGNALRRGEQQRAYLVSTRGIDASRIVVLDGGTREQLRTVLWIVPAGATPPPM